MKINNNELKFLNSINMKILKFCLIAVFTVFLFSCNKETEGLSRSTYYVAFEIQGDNPVIMQVGDEYVDAGAIATLQGKDVTSTMTIKSNVVDSEMGLYKVEYSAVCGLVTDCCWHCNSY